MGCFRRAFAPGRSRAGADGLNGATHRADAGCYGCVGTAPAGAAARSDLSALPVGTGRLSPLQPRPERGAGLLGDLCKGIPAERHGDYSAHELLLAARLGSQALDLSTSAYGADQSGADNNRRSTIDENGHRHLREMACRSHAAAGSL